MTDIVNPPKTDANNIKILSAPSLCRFLREMLHVCCFAKTLIKFDSSSLSGKPLRVGRVEHIYSNWWAVDLCFMLFYFDVAFDWIYGYCSNAYRQENPDNSWQKNHVGSESINMGKKKKKL